MVPKKVPKILPSSFCEKWEIGLQHLGAHKASILAHAEMRIIIDADWIFSNIRCDAVAISAKVAEIATLSSMYLE